MRFASMEEKAEKEEAKSSVFPLFPSNPSPNTTSHHHPQPHQWLSNTSFTPNLSAVNTAVTSIYDALASVISDEPQHDNADDSDVNRNANGSDPKPSYEMLDDANDVDGQDNSPKSKAKKKKRRRRNRDDDDGDRRKKSWPSSGSKSSIKAAKEYYFDSRGDRDNLAFGCIYRMDLSRYRLINSAKISHLEVQALYRRNQMGSNLDKDGDIDKLDNKLKSSGRYWSAKYSALERHKNLKRLRVVGPKKSAMTIPSGADDFIPLSTSIESSGEGITGQSVLATSTVEESWEEEVSRKTKEFNKMTREHPHDEKGWLAFAEFQETVASMQPQKGARLQTLEKKISILEKASELNPENEELLLCLLKSYQTRDSADVLIGRWEKVLMQHSGSCRLWKEFLHVVQGEFSRFKVSEMRKMFTHAIHALSSACSKQYRQVTTETVCKEHDPSIVQLELGLIDVFVSLCRFEWQAGYQELATACFQAQIEYSLFSPSLYLTETSKQRLFEHFWNSDGARIGEEAALGWSTWLTKEEESRQKGIEEELSHDNDEGGWTGWSNPLSKQEKISHDNDDSDVKELEDELMTEDIKNEDDTEALLKKLGIDIDAEADGEVKDISTWVRWSEEESSRDCEQWMPFHAKSTAVDSHTDASPEREADEQLSRVILFEEVSEFLFSLSSAEARLSLILQFIDFFGGKISQRICTNNSIWGEKLLSLDVLPDMILECLGNIHDVLNKSQSSCADFNLEKLLESSNDISKKTSMMKFLRNSVLLCLTVFPRNYILEEAALVAEDLSITKMNTCRLSVTPCRPLAKYLLKCDRQDLLLCGIYAQREAAFGNIEYARKVFDMALSSVEGLPLDLQSNAPLLYFWYAEAELANSSGNSFESSLRAIHILSCLGSGISYSTFKCRPSSMQLLKAHQGFTERIRTVRSTWARGAIHDSSIALICSSALFEELTTGGAAGLKVLDHTFSMVLPERKRQSYQLEYLFNYYVKMLKKHCKQSKSAKVWEVILNGLQIYPLSPELFSCLIEISHLYSVPNKLRWMFDDVCHKKPSVIVWIFALSYELSRQGSQHRVHALFEKALENEQLQNSVILWRCYIAFEINVLHNLSAARRIFFRAIHACPWSKKLWLDGFQKLSAILTAKELSDLQEVMRDKELNLRTDIYEILLQDESKSFQ